MKTHTFVAFLAAALPFTVRAYATNLLLPLYVYPTPGAWDNVYAAIRTHPDLAFQIVVNPSSGPGPAKSTGYDANWVKGIGKLNKYANAQTFGYVHLLNGGAPAAAVEANITRWAAWNAYGKANISMAGIFFDETPDSQTAYMQGLADFARAQLGAQCRIIFNPGMVSDTDYFAMADTVIVSETLASTYTSAVSTANVAAQYAAKAAILVYEFVAGGGTYNQLQTWVQGMVDAGIGSVNVVSNGWDGANAEDGPADIDTVATLLVEAQGGHKVEDSGSEGSYSRRKRSTLAIIISFAAVGMTMAL